VILLATLFEGSSILTLASANKRPAWYSDRALHSAKNAIMAVAVGTLLSGYGDLVADWLVRAVLE